MPLDPFRFIGRVVSRLRDIDLARAAGSLSFTTLLAIVPMITVAFSFVGRFPIFEDWLKVLEQFMLKHLLPFSAAGEIRGYITGFADQAARLTGVSVALIAVSAALAIATVEREINAIWGIRGGRSLPRRIVTYALGLTAVPVLIGAMVVGMMSKARVTFIPGSLFTRNKAMARPSANSIAVPTMVMRSVL